jgi:nucleoside-diphosphate-sugar epimerase
MAGYSGTPLAKKLGIKEGHVVGLVNEPDGFRPLLEPLPGGVELAAGVRSRRDIVVMFARKRSEVESKLAAMTKAIFPDGAIWIAWPKKAAAKQLGIDTDIVEDTVRAVALPTGLVDNKVCAIDDTWSGLRLVVRRENRR